MVSLTYINNKIRLLTNIDVDFAQFLPKPIPFGFVLKLINVKQSFTITNLVSYMLHEIFPTDFRFRIFKSLDSLSITKKWCFNVCCVCFWNDLDIYIKISNKYLISKISKQISNCGARTHSLNSLNLIVHDLGF